jgi:hypothetical protein
MKKEATLINAKDLIQKTSDEKSGNPKKTQRDSFKRHPIKKEATQENAKGLIQKTSNGQKDNHSKNLVPHQKLANQHSNLKGVSSQYL